MISCYLHDGEFSIRLHVYANGFQNRNRPEVISRFKRSYRLISAVTSASESRTVRDQMWSVLCRRPNMTMFCFRFSPAISSYSTSEESAVFFPSGYADIIKTFNFCYDASVVKPALQNTTGPRVRFVGMIFNEPCKHCGAFEFRTV